MILRYEALVNNIIVSDQLCRHIGQNHIFFSRYIFSRVRGLRSFKNKDERLTLDTSLLQERCLDRNFNRIIFNRKRNWILKKKKINLTYLFNKLKINFNRFIWLLHSIKLIST
jgi:hypothetical protein